MDTQEFLTSVLREIATTASMGAAYEAWSDEFARNEVREAGNDCAAPLRNQRGRRVTVAELRAVGVPALRRLGFAAWDEALTVIPLWAYQYVADGESLTSIDGEVSVKGKDYINLDVRFGCIAFGFPTPVGFE